MRAHAAALLIAASKVTAMSTPPTAAGPSRTAAPPESSARHQRAWSVAADPAGYRVTLAMGRLPVRAALPALSVDGTVYEPAIVSVVVPDPRVRSVRLVWSGEGASNRRHRRATTGVSQAPVRRGGLLRADPGVPGPYAVRVSRYDGGDEALALPVLGDAPSRRTRHAERRTASGPAARGADELLPRGCEPQLLQCRVDARSRRRSFGRRLDRSGRRAGLRHRCPWSARTRGAEGGPGDSRGRIRRRAPRPPHRLAAAARRVRQPLRVDRATSTASPGSGTTGAATTGSAALAGARASKGGSATSRTAPASIQISLAHPRMPAGYADVAVVRA